ncbi:endonuclease MutS2 [Candidatus Manganitrophus noduliformans]|uniref:Endonuclease MutS2 n=1 Tax=Candidatus Manganitrophus noduliformans TaxID=2606439 RepID=A0A7X6DRK0_9BACT|nr:endonuclease MutS2 [Candidatus Manganitrophus noduliformans]NKE71932.1 endonuclease MutS2 [Candidatus Manganitrophus noduliformans]
MQSNPLYEQSFTSLGWPEIVEFLARQAALPITAERCRALPFLEEPGTVRERLAVVWEGVLLLKEGSHIPLSSFTDPRPFLARANKGAVLEGIELRGIHDLLEQVESVRSFLIRKKEEASRLFQIAVQLEPPAGLRQKIAAAVDPEGRIQEGATPALRALTAEAARAREAITDQLEKILRSARYEKLLQEPYYTEREGRYVLPFKIADQNKEGGVVHDLSASGATAFVEPRELVGSNNRLRVAQLAVSREVERILRSLSEEVGREAGRLTRNLEILAEIDLLRASANLAERIGGICPKVNAGGAIRLFEARHPLLLLRKGSIVPNDILLEEGRRALILSGPNTGGKTVLLKTVGLLALMVRAGLPIPCREGSEIPLFPAVIADIGDDQDLSRDLSSFSAHLLKILAILETAPGGSLILLDELVTSTDPAEGAALAAAILTELADRGMRIVTTTHYPSLKGLAQADPRFLNGSLAFDLERLAPTYRLVLGTPGRSAALEMAARLGLPASILERAKEHLRPNETTLERIISELERERRNAEEERRRLEALRAEAEAAAAAQKEGAARWAMSEREIQKKIRQKVAEAVAEARSEIATLMASLKEKRDPALIKKGRAVLEEIGQKAGDTAARKEPSSAPGPLQVGRRVEVLPLGKQGVLLDPPEGSKKVRVQIGSQILFVSPEAIEGVIEEEREEGPPAPVFRSAGPAESTVNLVGKRVEEALEILERFLDRAILGNEREIRLVHGHGSGKLKKAVREYLPTSPYVARFRPGDLLEGGDAVTIITLKEE